LLGAGEGILTKSSETTNTGNVRIANGLWVRRSIVERETAQTIS